MSRRALGAGAATVAATAVAGVALLGAPAEPAAPRRDPLAVPSLPVPARPAFAVPALRRARPGRHATRWAPVVAPTFARAAPRSSAPRVARLGRRTPEGTANLVVALRRTRDAHGGVWVRVRLPMRAPRDTGWVRRSTLGGYRIVRTRLLVDRRRLTATLLRDGRPVFRARVGVGTRRAPTPAGRFYVRDVVTRYRSPMYGPVAFGTSARSATLTDWPGGGFVGVHGTDRPDLIPGRVSHGCIRMRNADVLRLARLMPVGTPLTIR
jgi:hypothetical protein